MGLQGETSATKVPPIAAWMALWGFNSKHGLKPKDWLPTWPEAGVDRGPDYGPSMSRTDKQAETAGLFLNVNNNNNDDKNYKHSEILKNTI